jgi:L-threonylcarbamoyladenylate synthase
VRPLVVDPSKCEPADLAAAVEWLRTDGVVAFPTDTYYGLAVDPTSSRAVTALFELKGRSGDAALPLIGAAIEQVEAFVGPFDASTKRLAARFWPGPLSLICPAPPHVDAGVHAGQQTVAIRVPDHRVARMLAAAFGRPLTATSANRSGEPPARTAVDLDPVFGASVLVVDAGPTAGGPPSTIVDARISPPALVRAGAVPWSRVLESLGA